MKYNLCHIYLSETSDIPYLKRMMNLSDKNFFEISVLKEEKEKLKKERDILLREAHQLNKLSATSVWDEKDFNLETDCFIIDDPLDFKLKDLQNTDKRICIKFKVNNIETLQEIINFIQKNNEILSSCILLFAGLETLESFKEVRNIFSLIPVSLRKNILYNELPFCLIPEDSFSTNPFFNGSEQIINNNTIYLNKEYFKENFIKIKSSCLDCFLTDRCLGIRKTSPLKKDLISSERTVSYAPLVERIYKLKPIIVKKDILDPYSERHINIPDIYKARVEENYVCRNSYIISRVNEKAIWWNRPLEIKENYSYLNEKGIWCYDLPFNARDIDALLFKTGYNILLPPNSLNVTSRVLFDSLWSEEDKQKLRTLTTDTTVKILEKYGDVAKISRKSNDVLYDGKKVLGQEIKFTKDEFIETTVITFLYKENIELFNQLTGEIKKPITGITDEIPELTRDVFEEEFYSRVLNFFKGED